MTKTAIPARREFHMERFAGLAIKAHERYFSDLTARYDAEDLLQELALVWLEAHDHCEQHGIDPLSVPDEEFDALVRQMAYNHWFGLISKERNEKRNYRRSVEADVTTDEDGEELSIFDILSEDDTTKSMTYAVSEILDDRPDVPRTYRPDRAAMFRENIDAVRSTLSDAATKLFDEIVDPSWGLMIAWKMRREESRTRTDSRCPYGLPWAVWADYLETTEKIIKSAIAEIRKAVGYVFGAKRIAALNTFAFRHGGLTVEETKVVSAI